MKERYGSDSSSPTSSPVTRPGQGGRPHAGRPIALRVAAWLLLLAAIPLGAAVGVVVLVFVAAATGNRVLAAAAGALALLAATGGLSLVAARGISGGRRLRRWLPAVVTALTLAVVAAGVGAVVFVFGPDATPLSATAATRYWDLPTGSRIAYTRTPAQGTADPAPVIAVSAFLQDEPLPQPPYTAAAEPW